MSPWKRKFRPEYALELLRIAESDLKTAEILVKSPEIRAENAFYHIQQAVEKSLKAVLVKQEIEVLLSHDLVGLLATLPDHLGFPFGLEIGELSSFAMVRRYEEGVFEPTEAEKQAALDLAKVVLSWAKDLIKPK